MVTIMLLSRKKSTQMNVKGIGYRIRGHTYHSYTEVPGRRDARLEHVSSFTNVCIARRGDGIVRVYVFVSTRNGT